MYDNNNVFAKILRGEIAAKIVCENEFALAFYDIFAQAPIHVLVIPKNAHINFSNFTQNASPDEIIGFYATVNKTIGILNLQDSGFRLISNSGVNGGQEVLHFHMHILGGEELGPMITKK
jgi:diadenosine tetraphosphate (Ap4A) HIT family hydrolase